jgi:hypothetical protein
MGMNGQAEPFFVTRSELTRIHLFCVLHLCDEKTS